MVESKSAYPLNPFNGHSEKRVEFSLKGINRLADDSERNRFEVSLRGAHHICRYLLVERNQFQDALSVPTDEQALQKCRSAH
jgi:hypothetical protein